MYESLEVRNYHMKFRELLESEKIAHEKLLKERLVCQNSVSYYPHVSVTFDISVGVMESTHCF